MSTTSDHRKPLIGALASHPRWKRQNVLLPSSNPAPGVTVWLPDE
ncbi:hypothetical protein [Arthrobacter sp. SD76]